MSLPARYTKQHAHPQGLGDARPTALQIVQDEHRSDELQGKTVLITGGNDGSGLEIARAMHMTGAKVFITARSPEKGNKAVQSVIKSNGQKGGIEALTMQLDDFESIRATAKEFAARSKRLNVLILSAGTMAHDLEYTKDGFENAFGCNHVGHFLLFQLLKPLLLESSTSDFNSRVVIVASISHRLAKDIHYEDIKFERNDEYSNFFFRYGHSKLANVWMANHLDRVYGSQGLHAWSLQPGGMMSPLVLATGLKPSSTDPHTGPFFKNPEQGAATTVWAAVSRDLEGRGGRYLESVEEIGPFTGTDEEIGDWTVPGYAEQAYNPEGEKKFWEYSEKLVEHMLD